MYLQPRWQITLVIIFLPWVNIITPTVSKNKHFTPRELLVITPNGILFISQTDLVKSFQMPVNASNLEKFPFLPQKVILEFVGSFEFSFSCSVLQLRMPGSIQLIRLIRLTESIASMNTKTINTINLID